MANDNEFVERRLDALKEGTSFEPDAAQARRKLFARKGETPRGGWKWVAVPAAAALAIALFLPAGRAAAKAGSGDGFSMEHVHGFFMAHWQMLVTMVHGPQGPPDFAAPDVNGKKIRLSDYRGKVVAVNFWATWCAPCQKEIPWLVELQREYPNDLVVVGVSFDEQGWKAVKPFLAEKHVNYPVVLAGDHLPDVYRKIESLPATIILNREGYGQGEHVGLSSQQQLRDLIAAELKGVARK
jgi:thiol-disulfide isomerase/thioredoxin